MATTNLYRNLYRFRLHFGPDAAMHFTAATPAIRARVPPNGAQMALSDVAANLTPGLPHQTCGTCHALAGMSDEDAATLRGLLADRGVRFSTLAKALADDPESPTIHHDALSRHARGLCSAREVLR